MYSHNLYHSTTTAEITSICCVFHFSTSPLKPAGTMQRGGRGSKRKHAVRYPVCRKKTGSTKPDIQQNNKTSPYCPTWPMCDSTGRRTRTCLEPTGGNFHWALSASSDYVCYVRREQKEFTLCPVCHRDMRRWLKSSQQNYFGLVGDDCALRHFNPRTLIPQTESSFVFHSCALFFQNFGPILFYFGKHL